MLLLWIFLLVWGYPCPPFISKEAGVTRKVPGLVTIVVLVGLYLQSFLITRYDLIRVGLYLWGIFYRHLVGVQADADPYISSTIALSVF
jgi:hypothetical protein